MTTKIYDIPQQDSPVQSSTVLIRDLNDDEKPREKAIAQGIDSLSDVELLALLLGSGVPGKSVIDLSREILNDNDNKLSRVSKMTIAELKRKYKGVGDAKATLLVAAMAFGARVQRSLAIADPQMRSSDDVYQLMRGSLERLNYEEFWVLHLTRANRVFFMERASKGGISYTAVDAKLIAKSAIDHITSSVILVHNHPSGSMQPSGPDDQLTRKIIDMLKIVDVSVRDHIIIGPCGYYSYLDNGRL